MLKSQIIAGLKFLLSFTKREWEFEDYPLEVYNNENAIDDTCRYGAKFTNWLGTVGHGETSDKAVEQLREHFELFIQYSKEHDKKIPRPGKSVPITFASTAHIELYEDIAEDFLYRMFGLKYSEGFYSDGSHLGYFTLASDEISEKEARRHIINRTLLAYDVDITDIYDEPLWWVLKRIKEHQSGQAAIPAENKQARP